MMVGTSYFVSMAEALRYYRPYGFGMDEVIRKLTDGEIHIGKPPFDPKSQRAVIIDGGCRYGVEDVA
jgi:hypothetical protein